MRILRSHIERLGYKRNFVIYNESEQLGAIKKILSHISDKAQKTDPHAVLSMLSRFRNGGQRASVFLRSEHRRSRPTCRRQIPKRLARLQRGGL